MSFWSQADPLPYCYRAFWGNGWRLCGYHQSICACSCVCMYFTVKQRYWLCSELSKQQQRQSSKVITLVTHIRYRCITACVEYSESDLIADEITSSSQRSWWYQHWRRIKAVQRLPGAFLLRLCSKSSKTAAAVAPSSAFTLHHSSTALFSIQPLNGALMATKYSITQINVSVVGEKNGPVWHVVPIFLPSSHLDVLNWQHPHYLVNNVLPKTSYIFTEKLSHFLKVLRKRPLSMFHIMYVLHSAPTSSELGLHNRTELLINVWLPVQE